MDQKLRVGIIGCGRVASTIEADYRGYPGFYPFPIAHAAAYSIVPSTELVAAAEIVPAKLEDFGQRWNVKNLYLDYHEMLVKEDLDLISVCTRAPLHAEVTIAAAEAGVRGVLCEKAMALNLAEAERMIETCRAAGAKLLVYHARRYEPLFLETKQLLTQGAIGRLQTVVAVSSGALVHNGTHIFDIIRFLTGADASWVVAHLDEEHQSRDDPGGSGYLHFNNGVRAFISLLGNCPVHLDIDLIGTEGRIRIGNVYAELWTVDRHSRFHELVQRPFSMTGHIKAALVAAIEDLVDCVMENREPVSRAEDGKAALELGLAFHKSEQEGGAKIHLPLQDKEITVVSV
ncbi:MAG: Gfo/Idh/MocA family oxidoreductase [Chloroflexi bacterium]|nr:Gfo/Idh/MocA family oxidoreductase [Chloroflexota bacterium]